MRSTTAVFFLLALSSFTACKPGARDWCERYAKAQCRFQYQCCNAAERQALGAVGFGIYHYDQPSCEEELTRVYCAAVSSYADAEENGRATWDHAKSNECLAVYEGAAGECDAAVMQRGTGDTGCALSELVTGRVADGETCYSGEECENDEAACVPNTADDGEDPLVTAKGTCTPPPGVGDECPDFSCASGAWCDASVDPRVCKAHKGAGDECAGNYECATGVCSYESGSGACAEKKADDEQCAADLECASAYCDQVAERCAAKRADGEACDSNSACLSGNCEVVLGQCAPVDVVEYDYDICLPGEQ